MRFLNHHVRSPLLGGGVVVSLILIVASGCSPNSGGPGHPAAASTVPAAASAGDTTVGGDIPDNAVFLTYSDASHRFSVQYVEGWQVSPSSTGVQIRDKDSSETIDVQKAVTDVAAYILQTDLPALESKSDFVLKKQDTVTIKGKPYMHLAYGILSPPDPVTAKRVPSTVDRYYVSGPAGLAVISLSTPDGVDNVDAFRQMIESFTWT